MTEYFAQTLASVLEETSTNMGNAMVLNHLSKNGAVTLEEAEFYHNLCTDVITEAAEDFIPDEIDVPDDQGDVPADQGDVPADQGDDDALPPIELFDAVGNKYVFQDGQLVPVDDDQDATDDVDQDAAAADDAAVPDDTTNQGDYQESEVVDEKAPVIEESEGIAEESEILEESSTVVARILANLK